MPRDFYTQPEAADPVLAPELVLALAQRHAPECRAITRVEESGGEARTYFVDERIVVKVQRPQQLRPRTSLEKEVFFLRQLATEAPELSVPRVLGYGREGRMIEYTVMTRMPGIALRHATLSQAQREAVLRQLGAMLHRIHALPLAPFVASDLFPGDQSFPDLQMRFGAYFTEMAEEIGQRGRPWHLELTPEAVGACAIAALPRTSERAALHSNPYLEHVFVLPESGAFSGLIDFGDAFLSHPAFDLRRWSAPADRAALLAGYVSQRPVSDAFLATWRIVMVLADLIAIAYYPERAANAEDDLARLLAEF